MTSSPWRSAAVSTTARMTALRPGQSPPPVRIPMRIGRLGVRSRARRAWCDRGPHELEARRQDRAAPRARGGRGR